MNAFAQLLPIPSTSWSFSHLMKVLLDAIEPHARNLCITPVSLAGFCSSGASGGCRRGGEGRCWQRQQLRCPVRSQGASWSRSLLHAPGTEDICFSWQVPRLLARSSSPAAPIESARLQ